MPHCAQNDKVSFGTEFKSASLREIFKALYYASMKIILLFVILFFAVGVMMALVARLSQTKERLADLHQQMNRNNEEMARHRRELERLAAQQEADKRQL